MWGVFFAQNREQCFMENKIKIRTFSLVLMKKKQQPVNKDSKAGFIFWQSRMLKTSLVIDY